MDSVDSTDSPLEQMRVARRRALQARNAATFPSPEYDQLEEIANLIASAIVAYNSSRGVI